VEAESSSVFLLFPSTSMLESTSSLKIGGSAAKELPAVLDVLGAPQLQKQKRTSSQAMKGIAGNKLSCSEWLRAS